MPSEFVEESTPILKTTASLISAAVPLVQFVEESVKSVQTVPQVNVSVCVPSFATPVVADAAVTEAAAVVLMMAFPEIVLEEKSIVIRVVEAILLGLHAIQLPTVPPYRMYFPAGCSTADTPEILLIVILAKAVEETKAIPTRTAEKHNFSNWVFDWRSELIPIGKSDHVVRRMSKICSAI